MSGGDFLPLTLKLDDLFTHLASINDLVSRLDQLNLTTAAPGERAVSDAVAAKILTTPTTMASQTSEDSITDTLAQLVGRVAKDRGKTARLVASGLATVPEIYRRAVKDIAIQALRNSLVHGIEEPAARAGCGKPTIGTIKVDFRDEGASGYRLVVEDDGAGLNLRRIREAAVGRGLIRSDEAANLDSKQLLPLLFRAGFSTVELADEDGGRGVGMNVVAALVKELKGRVGLASGEGRYTRLTIMLPSTSAPAAQVA